jgi:hypothetical protein
MRYIMGLCAFAAFVTLALFAIARDHREREQCEQRGGVIIKFAGQMTCVKLERIPLEP